MHVTFRAKFITGRNCRIRENENIPCPANIRNYNTWKQIWIDAGTTKAYGFRPIGCRRKFNSTFVPLHGGRQISHFPPRLRAFASMYRITNFMQMIWTKDLKTLFPANSAHILRANIVTSMMWWFQHCGDIEGIFLQWTNPFEFSLQCTNPFDASSLIFSVRLRGKFEFNSCYRFKLRFR